MGCLSSFAFLCWKIECNSAWEAPVRCMIWLASVCWRLLQIVFRLHLVIKLTLFRPIYLLPRVATRANDGRETVVSYFRSGTSTAAVLSLYPAARLSLYLWNDRHEATPFRVAMKPSLLRPCPSTAPSSP